MYNDFGSPDNSYRPQRAFEIELRVREMEKKYALMNSMNHHVSGNSFILNLKKTAHRLSSLVSALFVA
jgi:hypothetical protein